jgi:hypothetical protein
VTDFQNYICWQEDAVLATTPRDAASLGYGHFQAVHHPLRLRRRRLDQRSGGRWVAEAEIVDALQGRIRPDGYLFIPIVGGSGTGKSHLVRWVRDQTQGVPNWESRYLPKNRTGIRRAIEIVIRGLTGPKIDEAWEALASAPSHTEADDVLAERLLDELALIVSHADEPPSDPTSYDGRQRQLREKLKRQLPDVLRDPVVRRKLVEPSAVIPRLVGLAIRGRQEGDGLDDDATHFLDSDLPLTFEEIGDASRGAHTLLGQLATIPDLLVAAVALINEALPSAEKRVSVSGQVDLVEVFRDVRRALLAEGKELVLFIEDLTVLHGIEHEFLDAIVEPARSDDGDMCNLRVIFAVTEGHFDDLDTVRTRCDDAFWLDAPYGVEGVDRDEALSFLGRYLNASRLPPVALERAWEQRQSNVWPPNACVTCPHREVCHDTFGTSDEGYGLYPFNPAAAGRFVEVLSPDRFDPRDVVRELVNRFLLQAAADMRQSEFPSDSLSAPFERDSEPLPPLVAAQLRNLRPTDHQRVINTLRYWSDEGSATSVKVATFDAFVMGDVASDLSALRTLGATTPAQPTQTGPPQGRTDTSPTVDARLGAPWRSHFAELAQWAGRNRDLSAKATNELRKLIHRTILANLEVGPTPIHLGQEFGVTKFRVEPHIGIEGTVTQQNLDSAVVVIDRTESNAAALQALILAMELEVDDDSQSTAQYRRLLAGSVDSWTADVVAKLSAPPAATVVSAVEGLILASALAGKSTGPLSAANCLEAMFRPSEERPADTIARTDRWVALVAHATSLIPKLRATVETEFGESRGTRGDVRAIQADRLLPIVEAFTSVWQFTSADAAIASLMRGVVPAVNEEWENLRTRVNTAAPHVSRDRTWQDQTEKVLNVLRAAHGAGRLRDAVALDMLTALAATNMERVHRSFFEAADLIAKETALQEKLAVLAGCLPGDVAVVHAFVARATTAIEGVERDLQDRQAASGGPSDMEAVVSRVLEATSRFADAVKGLAP